MARPVRAEAHPRSRGENLEETSLLASCPGSSPLTRGKPTEVSRQLSPARLIPAHAGKTNLGCNRCARHGAHPRSRGENRREVSETLARSGSSPLTRGKLGRFAVWRFAGRLIPAHAGKTPGGAGGAALWAAHPRSRGENLKPAAEKLEATGSSPLTRGKPLDRSSAWLRTGLIPAHAGKTRP